MVSRNFACTIIGYLFSTNAFAAFEVSPIILKGAPSGSKASFSITAINSGDTKTPVQIAVYHREPDANGKEDFEKARDASELFQIIPSQVILKPKERKTIRFTYMGDKNLKAEQAFRFIAEEFPVNVSDSSKVKNKTVASISILSKYVGSIFITPEGSLPNLTATATLDKTDGTNKMLLVFKNAGTAHKILSELKMKILIENDKKEYEFSTDSMQAIGNQNILAGREWRTTIPWPKEIPVSPVKISFEDLTKPKN